MKKIFFSIIATAAVLAGCNREIIEQKGSGSLAIDLSCDSDYTEVQTKATDDEIINDLAIDIVRPYDSWKVNYTPFSSIRGKVVELGSGAYILTASSQKKEHAAFDQPIYSGSKDFNILTGQVTTIDVVCAITNVKVTVNLSDNFVKELSDYTVTVSNGKGNLSWNRNANEDDFKPTVVDGSTVFTSAQAGYFTVAPLSVVVDGHRAIDNTSASTSLNIDNVNAADHHILNLDARVTGQLGDVDENGNVTEGIKITISHDVNPINQPVTVPGFEEIPVEGDKPSTDGDDSGEDGGDDSGDGNDDTPVTPSTTPSIVWDANPDYAEMSINDNLNADMVIKVPNKISTFKVKVDSPQLTEAIEGLTVDGSDTMDLINDEELIAFLAEAAPNLPTGAKLLGKSEVNFFLTDLVKMITMYGPAAGDKHKFTLDILDQAGETFSQTLTFVSE